MIFKLCNSHLLNFHLNFPCHLENIHLDWHSRPNNIFKKSTNLFRQIKASDIIRLFLSMLVCKKATFLSDKKGLIVFTNFLLSKTFSYLRTHITFFFPFFITYYKSFFCFLHSLRLVSVLVLKYFVSSWDLRIIAFLKVFVMHGAWSVLRIFFLNCSCLFSTSRKVVPNDSLLEIR